MQTFDQALLEHVQAGRVTLDDAMNAASNPHDFKLLVSTEGRRSTSMDDVALVGGPAGRRGAVAAARVRFLEPRLTRQAAGDCGRSLAQRPAGAVQASTIVTPISALLDRPTCPRARRTAGARRAERHHRAPGTVVHADRHVQRHASSCRKRGGLQHARRPRSTNGGVRPLRGAADRPRRMRATVRARRGAHRSARRRACASDRRWGRRRRLARSSSSRPADAGRGP